MSPGWPIGPRIGCYPLSSCRSSSLVPRVIRLGTRGSKLALAQTNLVAEWLRRQGHEVQVVTIVTEGDMRPIDLAPGEGVFVTALERALRRGEIDVAVHSAKDLPLDEDAALTIGAFPERADPRDVLVTRKTGALLISLPTGARVGTDSPRRAGFLRALRNDLEVVPLHGNVDTRLKRLDAGEVDALVLAAAGLMRLDRADRVGEWLDAEIMPPAPGQGALAVQARRSDPSLVQSLRSIDDHAVRVAVAAERSVLEATGGSCRAPLGALARASGNEIELIAGAVNPDGADRHIVHLRGQATIEAARKLGLEAGGDLLAHIRRPVSREP